MRSEEKLSEGQAAQSCAELSEFEGPSLCILFRQKCAHYLDIKVCTLCRHKSVLTMQTQKCANYAGKKCAVAPTSKTCIESRDEAGVLL